MSEMGKAMMGTGEADGEERALKAAEAAISNPLLDDVSMKGARGVLINITGGPDMMLFEVDQAANRIRAEVDPDANIIFGGTILENMEGRLRVSVVATGIEAEHVAQLPPNVEQLRPRARGTAQPIVKPEARPVASPVHTRVEALAQEMNATLATAPSPAPVHAAAAAEPAALGRSEPSPVVVEGREPIPEPVRIQPAAASRPAPSIQAQPQRRGPFGLFGVRRKTETPRAEPQMSPTPPYAGRATAEPLGRNAQSAASPQNNADDLFADQKKDEFEIPAFLRRQSN
jgi:cell division protein FtsZ